MDPEMPDRRKTFILVMAMMAIEARAQQSLQFDVASIKRNTSGEFAGDTRQTPDGSVTSVNVPLRYFLGLAWPSADGEHRNLPGWATANRYDVVAKPPAGASAVQIKEMWRNLLKERFKLEAHDEIRDTPVYALVVARAGRLGPQLKRSVHDCAGVTPQARSTVRSDADVMAGCESRFFPGKLISDGTLMSAFAEALGRGLAGRLVEDRTGLAGYYALTLTYTPVARTASADVALAASDPPSIFTAMQEQLGLKLESVRKPVQTVVIDHIEPPTEN